MGEILKRDCLLLNEYEYLKHTFELREKDFSAVK